MNYNNFITKNKTKRDAILNILRDIGDSSTLFRLTYSHLHPQHKEFHDIYCNKRLLAEVSNMSMEKRYNLLKEIM